MSELMKEYIDDAEKVLLHTYNRYQVVLEKGDGVYLEDIDGKKYLDFCSGIGVFALGYNVKAYNDALKAQIDKITHTSNYYYNIPAINAAKKLTKFAKMDRVFFTNSGAEAVEGAIKAAVKYAYNKNGAGDYEIIAMDHSFHGRTCGALAITGKQAYREPFAPLLGEFKFAEFNNLESVKALITDKTCAIIMETLQGEGGIYPASKEFIEGVNAICKEKDIVLILDEIQCGMGRTGANYAWHNYDVQPDIMTTAKAVGGGVPVGAFLLTEKVAQNSLVAGDHGTTYGGNPLAGAAIDKTMDLFEELKVTDNVKEVGAYLYEKLEELASERDDIVDHRGLGLMQGLEFNKPVGDIIAKAIDNGLILINAGANIIRFLPPLVITKKDVDDMLVILKQCL
ncbi:MAG: aspartate aminotransferase family protein [Lachnospiraceae bacterium]|nr:aspartate aminotransferase family protein [Lachnospiraceae bacterium]